MKKIVKGILIMGALTLLAACSNGKQKENSSAKGETVSIWIMGDGADGVDKVFEKFTEETDIEVDYQTIPWGSAHDRLLTAIASGDGPDVVQIGSTQVPEFADDGALMDISDYIDKIEAFKMANFFDGIATAASFENKYYGVPWYTETRALFYRSDLLESVGYQAAPKTWEELQDAAKKLSERGKGLYGLNIDHKENNFGFMFAEQNGSALLDDQGQPLFNEPEFVEAIDYLNNLVQKGYAPKQELGVDITQSFGGEGVLPMFISGQWMINSVKENAPDVEGKWKTAMLPTGKANNNSVAGGSVLSLWKSTKNIDRGLKLIEFMITPESEMDYFEGTGSLPALKAAWSDERLKDEFYGPFGEQLNYASNLPSIPAWTEVSTKYGEYWEQIVVGGADVQKSMDQLNEEAKVMLNK